MGIALGWVLPYVDIFMPNEDEMCRMARCSNLDDAIQALSVKPAAVVVKRGRRGVRVYQQTGITDVEPISVTPVDTIGAGDSFDAGFLRAYLLNKDVVECARIGNITGALSTQCSGGTEAFRDTVLRDAFLKKHQYFELLAWPM